MSDYSDYPDPSFVGAAVPLAPGDLSNAAARAGVPPRNLAAVLAVETGGRGFDPAGRPTMLFEPHVFYRNLVGFKRDDAVTAGLAYPNWGEQPYPPSGDPQYARLLAAIAIEEEPALRSCSWGLGQILGENYATVGYASAAAMVKDAMAGEAQQLGQMLNFIKRTGLLGHLARGEWAEFARGYNGAGYAANHYDQKLAAYAAAHQQVAQLEEAVSALRDDPDPAQPV